MNRQDYEQFVNLAWSAAQNGEHHMAAAYLRAAARILKVLEEL